MAETPTETPVTRWRKRPVTVEAVQWTGDNVDQMYELAGCQNFDVLDEQDRQNCDDPDATAAVFGQTHNTWLLVTPGQWVVKGVQGELYPCGDDIFRATHDPAVIDGVSPGQAFRIALHDRWTARSRPVDQRPWDTLPEIDRDDMEFAAQRAIAASGLPETTALLTRLLNGVVMEAQPDLAAAARNEAEELLTAITAEEDFLTANGQSVRGTDLAVIAKRLQGGTPSPIAEDRDRLADELDKARTETAELREERDAANSDAEQYRQMMTAVNGDANKLRIEGGQVITPVPDKPVSLSASVTRRHAEQIRAENEKLRSDLAEARAVIREYDEFAKRDTVPFGTIRAGLRQRAGIEAGSAPADLVRSEKRLGSWDVTCGSCGEEFGTNLAVYQIACPECEAQRCPNCRTWFGGES